MRGIGVFLVIVSLWEIKSGTSMGVEEPSIRMGQNRGRLA